jgi:hypothetical protein
MSGLPAVEPRFEMGTAQIRCKISILYTARLSDMRGRMSGRKNGRKRGSTNEIHKEEMRKTVAAYHNLVA